MKKAILFEPTLLAEVERESPAVFKNYRATPYARIEFADYGTTNLSMLMPRFMLFALESN